MTQMLVRNRVADFNAWKAVFDAQSDAGCAAGLTLVNMWRATDDPNNVFFLLDVEDVDRANAYINSPEAEKTGETSGVIDGEFHYVEPTPV